MVRKSTKLRTIREIIKVYNKKTEPKLKKWLNGSAEYGFTTSRNNNIFRSIGIIPRVLRKIDNSIPESNFFGVKTSSPFLIAPMGGISQFNKKAEHIISEGAEKMKIPFFFPNNSSYLLSEINPKQKKKYLFRSLYLDADLDYCKKNIEESEKYKCKAIAITVDSPIRPVSYNKTDTGHDSRKHYKKFGLKRPKKNPNFTAPLNWKVIEYIKKITDTPIILKGILSKEDVKIAESLNVEGIWISNHGGRNLETDITSIEVIEDIKNILTKKTKLILDGGIRTGSDMFKALALGADFVAIGRPIIYALTADREIGVNRILELFSHEFKSTMRICGCKNISDINNNYIVNRLKNAKDIF